MTCCTELQLSRHADGALASEEATATEAHVATCVACRTRLAALRAEVVTLAAALARDAARIEVPAFARPASGIGAAVTASVLVVAAGLASAVPDWLGFSLPAPLAWLDPLEPARLVELAIRIALFVTLHGGDIVISIAEVIGFLALFALVLWAAFALRARAGASALLVALAGAVCVLPPPAHALEIRHEPNGRVSIGAGETIADTLIAVGETVEIDGNVEGDLIAVGRRVAIRGRVSGLVVTAATTVTLDGEVGGSALGFARTIDVSSPRIGGNLYAFGEAVNTEEGASVIQNAIVGAQRAEFAGPVGQDVLGFAEEVEVGSTVGGDMTAYAARIELLAPARIAGGIVAHLPDAKDLTLAPGAVVGGEVTTHVREREVERHHLLRADHWIFQAFRFGAALLTGVVLLTLVPGLRGVPVDGTRRTFVATGIGIVALVSTPIIAVLVALTLVGLPLAFLGVMLWLAGLYLAKVVFAHAIGARILPSSGTASHFVFALAAGLALVTLAVNLPFVGSSLNFLMTSVGLGLLLLYVRIAWRTDSIGR